MTVAEVAHRLHVSVDWVYERAKAGDLPSYKLPGGRRIFRWSGSWPRSRSGFGRVGRCRGLGRRRRWRRFIATRRARARCATRCTGATVQAGIGVGRSLVGGTRSGSGSSRIGRGSSGGCTTLRRSGSVISWRAGWRVTSGGCGRRRSSASRSRFGGFPGTVNVDVQRHAAERKTSPQRLAQASPVPVTEILDLAKLSVDAVPRAAVALAAGERDLTAADAPRRCVLERDLLELGEPAPTDRTDVAGSGFADDPLKGLHPILEPAALPPLALRDAVVAHLIRLLDPP